MSDSIDKLPIDEEAVPTSKELKFVKELFQKDGNKQTVNTAVSELKDYLLSGGLFIIFSLNFVNNILKNILPFGNGSYIIFLIIKALLFSVVFYVIRNFVLAFK